MAAASGSCRLDTTERSAPTSAMLKKTKAEPSTKATAATCQNPRTPAARAATMLPIAVARTRSIAIMSRLRSTRSATTPASSANSA
ncbi:MAG TPA: hypothetical protein VE984_04890 [Gaiellaceae bacterium]|nr:hypothetical protein [Gaiellaceae bacterium]